MARPPILSPQITIWDDPIETVFVMGPHGKTEKLDYSDWLDREALRIGGCEVRRKVLFGKERISLWRKGQR